MGKAGGLAMRIGDLLERSLKQSDPAQMPGLDIASLIEEERLALREREQRFEFVEPTDPLGSTPEGKEIRFRIFGLPDAGGGASVHGGLAMWRLRDDSPERLDADSWGHQDLDPAMVVLPPPFGTSEAESGAPGNNNSGESFQRPETTRALLTIVSLFCAEPLRSSVERDLEEGYEGALKHGGRNVARLYLWRQVFGLIASRIGRSAAKLGPTILKLFGATEVGEIIKKLIPK
jgi:hypothetical protein